MYDLKKFLQLSDEQQYQQMQEWLSSIATAEEEQRQQGIKELVLANSKDDADKTKVIEIRTIVLARMPMDQIKDILRSRRQAMQDLKDIDEADRAMVIMMVRDMPTDVQQSVARVVAELREEFADRR